MPSTVSDFIVQRLDDWGVRRLFGYPGDGINGLMGALNRTDLDIEFIQTRHEELAAFMACAHAKFTGQVGVCVATSGPGAIHLLNGLYDAALDNMPVVAIVGQQKTISLGGDFQQEVDLTSLFKDVAHRYVHMVSNPAAARVQIDQAMRIAIAERDVTCVILPADVQEQDYEEAPPVHGAVYTGVGYRRPIVVPGDHDLREAAEVLNQGKQVAMLVGAGALGAGDQVVRVAEKLGAGVAKALLGKAVIDDDLPWCTGAIGLLGTEPSDFLMRHCDTLLMVGTSFPYCEWLPKPGKAKAVQIDIKPRKLSLRYPVDVPLHGDSKATLEALLPMLEKKPDTSWQEQIEDQVAAWWSLLDQRAHREADPINPQLVFWELSKRLPDDCILASDSGSASNWFARDLKVRTGMMASLSGGLATMCPGVPYALAAKLAYPDRVAIAMVGDGAMQMLGNNALITIADRWQDWEDPRLVVCVLNNRDLNQVTWEQRVMSGDPKFEASQNLPGFSYADYAKQLGLVGVEVKTPDAVGPAWDEALSADRPVVLDVHTDPDVAPLPPHISFNQARQYLHSILAGEADSPGHVVQAVKGAVQSWLPGSGEK